MLEIFAAYRSDVAVEQAFGDRFGTAPPEELNAAQRLTVIASDIDAATQRIVTYLNTGFAVPVNVVFFRYYHDDGREYVARTWLIDEAATPPPPVRKTGQRSREPWKGRDWYVSFGEERDSRNWDDARRWGFVSAGGGAWFSKTIRALPVGGRVFAYIPKPATSASARGAPHRRVDRRARRHRPQARRAEAVGQLPPRQRRRGDAEYVVPLQWAETRPQDKAVWEHGLFANQNSACKLRNKFTIDAVTAAFSPKRSAPCRDDAPARAPHLAVRHGERSEDRVAGGPAPHLPGRRRSVQPIHGHARGLPAELWLHTQNWIAEDQVIADLVGVSADGWPVDELIGSHDGYHWLYVLRGRLRVVLGDKDFILTEGEVAEFDTHLPHWFGNADEHPVEFLSILGPQCERVHIKARYRPDEPHPS